MRKLLFSIGLLIISVCSFSQNQDIRAHRFIVDGSLYMKNWADTIQNDTINWKFKPRSIPTSKAVFDFTDTRLNQHGLQRVLSVGSTLTQ